MTIRQVPPGPPMTGKHELMTPGPVQNRDLLGRGNLRLRAAFSESVEGSALATDLPEVMVAPDTYHVSPEPMLMIADLHGALALCLHDEGRAVGGLLPLPFIGGTGRPGAVNANTLSCR